MCTSSSHPGRRSEFPRTRGPPIRVAFADFSSAPRRGLQKIRTLPQQLLPVSAAGGGRRRCKSRCDKKRTSTRMCTSGSHPGRRSEFPRTRGLTKAPLGLWLRCCAPPPCSNPAATKKEPVHKCVLVLFGRSSGI